MSAALSSLPRAPRFHRPCPATPPAADPVQNTSGKTEVLPAPIPLAVTPRVEQDRLRERNPDGTRSSGPGSLFSLLKSGRNAGLSQPTPTQPGASRAAATTCGYAAVDDIRMYYEIHGSGPPVLMLNGGYQTADDYRFMADRLADAHQVILIDHRGRGRTGDGRGPITYARVGEDVVGLLDHLGIQKVDLIGHSEGGCVALELLLHHADRVQTATLIGTPLDVSETHRQWFAKSCQALKEGRFSETSPVEATMHEVFMRLAPDPSRWRQVVDKLFTGWASQSPYTEDALRTIQLPVQVIRTEHDHFVPAAAFDQTARAISGATVYGIPEAGHNVPMTHPDEVAGAIRAFLAEHASDVLPRLPGGNANRAMGVGNASQGVQA